MTTSATPESESDGAVSLKYLQLYAETYFKDNFVDLPLLDTSTFRPNVFCGKYGLLSRTNTRMLVGQRRGEVPKDIYAYISTDHGMIGYTIGNERTPRLGDQRAFKPADLHEPFRYAVGEKDAFLNSTMRRNEELDILVEYYFMVKGIQDTSQSAHLLPVFEWLCKCIRQKSRLQEKADLEALDELAMERLRTLVREQPAHKISINAPGVLDLPTRPARGKSPKQTTARPKTPVDERPSHKRRASAISNGTADAQVEVQRRISHLDSIKKLVEKRDEANKNSLEGMERLKANKAKLEDALLDRDTRIQELEGQLQDIATEMDVKTHDLNNQLEKEKTSRAEAEASGKSWQEEWQEERQRYRNTASENASLRTHVEEEKSKLVDAEKKSEKEKAIMNAKLSKAKDLYRQHKDMIGYLAGNDEQQRKAILDPFEKEFGELASTAGATVE